VEKLNCRFLFILILAAFFNIHVFADVPTTQASNIVFSNVSGTQMTINWTNGDGAKRVVFMRQNYSGTCSPVHYTTYTANSSYASGDILSTYYYCVYNGSGNSVTVDNIDPTLQYVAFVFEYNGEEGSENYLTTSGLFNPRGYGYFSGNGSGTEAAPFEVTSASELADLGNFIELIEGYYFKIMNDINLTDYLSETGEGYNGGAFWEPIGGNLKMFISVVDGNNKTISGLKINTTNRYTGLFGQLGYDANNNFIPEIKNLTVELDDYGIVCTSNFVGGLVGKNGYGIITNCHISGGPVSGVGACGGLAGDNSGYIGNSSASCNVISSGASNGGLIGSCSASSSAPDYGDDDLNSYIVYKCYSSGNVTSTTNGNNGGLIGRAYASKSINIAYSYATGNVQGDSPRTNTGNGGFVGYAGGQATYLKIYNCYSTGNVIRNSGSTSTYTCFGGFVGYHYCGVIQYCYSTGSVTYADATNPTSNGFCGTKGTSSAYNSNDFWDVTTSGQSNTAGNAIGKSTANMKTSSTFSNAGWDVTGTIWKIDETENINNGYPFLAWQNSGGTPLPVELTSFTASVVDNSVKLAWQTATEVNNYGFQVQRNTPLSSPLEGGMSETRGVWDDIGFVQGSGNSNSPKSYSYTDTPTGCNTFKYRLKQIDFDGAYEYSDGVEVTLDAITEYSLEQNYPNPFNPTTTIKYQVPEAGNVTLKIYDTLGREVKTLVNETQSSGVYSVEFNASQLASGIYIYKLQSGDFVSVKKLMLMK
jgi:hypothetical protein